MVRLMEKNEKTSRSNIFSMKRCFFFIHRTGFYTKKDKIQRIALKNIFIAGKLN